MGILREIQNEHRQATVAAGFGDPEKRHFVEGFLGVVEEVGELSHAILKLMQHQNGRRDPRYQVEQLEEAKKDAVGDIMLFLMDYCNLTGIDMEAQLVETWELVKRRWSED